MYICIYVYVYVPPPPAPPPPASALAVRWAVFPMATRRHLTLWSTASVAFPVAPQSRDLYMHLDKAWRVGSIELYIVFEGKPSVFAQRLPVFVTYTGSELMEPRCLEIQASVSFSLVLTLATLCKLASPASILDAICHEGMP